MKIKEGFTLVSFCRKYVLKSKDDPTTMINFNESTAFLWNEAVKKGDFTEDDLLASLCSEYEVEEEVARQAVSEVVNGWRELGAIEFGS